MMIPEGFADSALTILHNLALENGGPWWKRMWRRWHISDEPLRNDAARLLRRYQVMMMRPAGTRYVGDHDS